MRYWMLIVRGKITFFLLFMTLHGWLNAAQWSCTNPDIEVMCSDKKCESHTNFTPISVTFDKKHTLSICAYSGCWEGRGERQTFHHYWMIRGQKLPFSSSPQSKEEFILLIDTYDNNAMIKGGGFVMPLVCLYDQ